MLKVWLARNAEVVRDAAYWRAAAMALLLLLASLVVNYFAGLYATERASSPVADLILSNTRAYDVDAIFVYGALAFWVGMACVFFMDLRLVPFALKSIALFTVIRSFFISLTHIGPFLEQPIADPGSFIHRFTFGGDLFFSGHTGLPFLMALIFWHNRPLRLICIVASAVFATAALLGHYHYSIDVFAAYLITDSIARLAQMAFPADLRLFHRSPIAGVRSARTAV